MAGRQLGIAVVGTGYWGPNIVRNLVALADEGHARLIRVCDLSEERLATLAARHPGLATTTDFGEVLRDSAVDAVVIATPIRTHFRLAAAALAAGKHVLVEKPLTASVMEAERLTAMARAVGRTLMVGHIFQYNPAVEALGDLVRSGALGEIYYVDCARLNLGLFQGDIDVLWDLAPHDLSILLDVLGKRPTSVSALGNAHVLAGIDDVGQINLRFEGGVTAQLRLSWLDPVKVRRVTVVGSEKMAVFSDAGADKLKVFDRRVALADLVEAQPSFDYHDGDIETVVLPEREPLRVQLLHFLNCIRTGATPRSDGAMGAAVVRILEAADTSRRCDGRWVDLPADQEPPAPAGRPVMPEAGRPTPSHQALVRAS